MRSALPALLAAALLALPTAALASSSGGSGEPKPSYFRLTPVVANVRAASGRSGVMQIDLGLDVPDAHLREKAEKLQPRLRAALLETLQVYAGGLLPGAAPNADLIAQKLQQRADQVIGQPGARLLLGSVTIN